MLSPLNIQPFGFTLAFRYKAKKVQHTVFSIWLIVLIWSDLLAAFETHCSLSKTSVEVIQSKTYLSWITVRSFHLMLTSQTDLCCRCLMFIQLWTECRYNRLSVWADLMVSDVFPIWGIDWMCWQEAAEGEIRGNEKDKNNEPQWVWAAFAVSLIKAYFILLFLLVEKK